MKSILSFLVFFFALAFAQVENNCVQFQVASGTGCDWMCNYCSNALGTNNYYFPDSVCTYEDSNRALLQGDKSGGCVGNPIAGKLYTCCSVGKTEL
jgi:hypothetical protein